MLEIENLSISRENQPLLTLPWLSVVPGQVATLMGPSGSGKSTVLRWLLGEALPDFVISGAGRLQGAALEKLTISQRRIGMLFQDVMLFPHMNVEDNLLFALPRDARFRNKQRRLARVRELLDAVALADHCHAMPDTLSGGQQARVALLRTLINEPRAVLLDEPFSALDSERRADVRQWVYDQLEQWQVPAILVTHDRDDAPKKASQRGPILTIEHGIAQCSTLD